jgi:hypothetical protein
MKYPTLSSVTRRLGDSSMTDDHWQKVKEVCFGCVGDIARKHGLTQEEADDVHQEVMIVVFRKRREFDPARALFANWVRGIAINKALDVLKKRGVRAQGGTTNRRRLQAHPAPATDSSSEANESDLLEKQLPFLLSFTWTQPELIRKGLPLLICKALGESAVECQIPYERLLDQLLHGAAIQAESHFGALAVQAVHDGKTNNSSWQAYLLFHVLQLKASQIRKLLPIAESAIFKAAARVQSQLRAKLGQFSPNAGPKEVIP